MFPLFFNFCFEKVDKNMVKEGKCPRLISIVCLIYMATLVQVPTALTWGIRCYNSPI